MQIGLCRPEVSLMSLKLKSGDSFCFVFFKRIPKGLELNSVLSKLVACPSHISSHWLFLFCSVKFFLGMLALTKF